MNDPVPMRDLPEPEQGRAERCLAQVEAPGEWALERRTAVYWAIRRRTGGALERDGAPSRPRHRLHVAAAVALVAAAAIVAIVLRPAATVSTASRAVAPRLDGGAFALVPQWHRVDLTGIGTVELSSTAGFELRELDSELQLGVQSGTLRAEVLRQDPQRPVVVVTPHLRVIVVGTRFDVRTDDTLTEVTLLEGKVRVEAGAAAVTLVGGESIRSDDPRLRAPTSHADAAVAPAPEPPGPSAGPATRGAGTGECAQLRGASRVKACYLRQAQGTGLTAQTALYALAILARDVDHAPQQALTLFRTYEARFPDGLFAPEVALGILQTVNEQGRPAEAVAAASAFEQRFAGDERVPEVALVRAELLCKQPEHQLEALAIFEQLQRTGPPALRTEVARARARCVGPVKSATTPDRTPPTSAGPPGD